MKFNIQIKKLLPLLQTVCAVVDKKPGTTILNNLLLVVKENEITFTSSDTEMEIMATIDHTSETTGETTIPAKKLLDICNAFDHTSTINFNLQDNQILLTSGRSKFNLMTLPAADFPKTETLENSTNITINAKNMSALIEDTQFSMALNDVRYFLNGLFLEIDKDCIRAVATDGHRLAIKEIKENFDINDLQEIIIPKKGVHELARLLKEEDGDINVNIDKSLIRISKDNIQITIKQIDGQYPDYRKVIPEGGKAVINADTETLRKVLARTSILSNEQNKGVRLSLKSGLLRVSAKNAENEEAQEEMEVDYVGEEFEIGFNAAYLKQAIEKIKTEHTILDVRDAESSCLILPDEDNSCKYVVMPMRL